MGSTLKVVATPLGNVRDISLRAIDEMRFSRFGFNRFRALTHRDVNEADVEQAILKLKKIFRS